MADESRSEVERLRKVVAMESRRMQDNAALVRMLWDALEDTVIMAIANGKELTPRQSRRINEYQQLLRSTRTGSEGCTHAPSGFADKDSIFWFGFKRDLERSKTE